MKIQVGIITVSDRASRGQYDDLGGPAVKKAAEGYGWTVLAESLVPDEKRDIQRAVRELINKGCALILTTGGTGVALRDVTPEALAPLIDREIPGIMEAARNYGQQRTPYAMLSRGIAGFIGNSLVITLPGSSRGSEETMDALFPNLLHVLTVKGGAKH